MAKTILITGGQLYNKGAQAMIFITVDELTKRFPDREIVVVSNMDYRRSAEDKAQYRFRILKFPKPLSMLLLQTAPGKWWYSRFGDAPTREFLEALQHSEAMINVSGYALGSNWGYKRSIYYMTMIGLARSVHAAVYLMPQSFGPFAYRGLLAPVMNRMIRKGLRYPKAVWCREKEGLDLLVQRYHLEQACCKPDLVLQNTGIHLEPIYRQEPALTVPAVPAGSVAVIPNCKTLLYGKEDALYALYAALTKHLLEQGKTVCYVHHSAEDIRICRKLKQDYFADAGDVQLIEQELSCIEFDQFVKQFDYVIASRFHAIVHAYKNGVPAIALGWATKYRELLALFDQEAFRFDVRGEIDTARFLQAVQEMEQRHEAISAAILHKLEDIRKENVYELIKL
ncbi:MAG: polysaccharide pyruvyl transferase family protein [Lachnospiraceae bacterium]|nr:polysaccharide pyruvyl transferase family protein [Lachnospiraceae bacterium]